MLALIKKALDNEQYRVNQLLIHAGAVWIEGSLLFENAEHALQNLNSPEQMKEVSL